VSGLEASASPTPGGRLAPAALGSRAVAWLATAYLLALPWAEIEADLPAVLGKKLVISDLLLVALVAVGALAIDRADLRRLADQRPET
jgi:hypothetical protein